jgi:hypothetical protein
VKQCSIFSLNENDEKIKRRINSLQHIGLFLMLYYQVMKNLKRNMKKENLKCGKYDMEMKFNKQNLMMMN